MFSDEEFSYKSQQRHIPQKGQNPCLPQKETKPCPPQKVPCPPKRPPCPKYPPCIPYPRPCPPQYPSICPNHILGSGTNRVSQNAVTRLQSSLHHWLS
uniref:Beta-b4 n=1 Tax=Emys orbicularis TaxID=82168 RepID=A0A0U4HEU5_EMYOR|nr:Beta-b4 [Emys orbicularis]